MKSVPSTVNLNPGENTIFPARFHTQKDFYSFHAYNHNQKQKQKNDIIILI